MTDINLSIPTMEVNTELEKFNPEKGAKNDLPRAVKDLLEENLTSSKKKKEKAAEKKNIKMHKSETKLRKNTSKPEESENNNENGEAKPPKKELTLGE